jgi:hypothetical protein
MHLSRMDGLLCVIDRVETDHKDLAGFSRSGDGLDRAQRHQVVAGKQSLHLRAGLQDVLKDVETLVPSPIGGLRGHDFNPGIVAQFLPESTQPGIGGNKQAAMFSGIPVDRRLVLVYATSGGFAAIAALVLAGRMNSGFPLAGVGAELDAIAAVIIGGASFFGGVGTVWGTMVGALIMGVLRNGLNLLNISSSWQIVVIGLVIVWAVWIDVLRRRTLQKPRPTNN